MQQREKKGRLLQTKDCHIGIIGSGLAGLSCALSILRSFSSSTSRDNNDELSSSTSSSTTFTGRITIYERNSNIHHYHQEQHDDDDDTKQHHKGGYGMTITYNPQGPLQKLGILEKVASRDCPSRCHYIFNNHGKIYGYFGNAYNNATVDDERGDGDVNGNEERRKNKDGASKKEDNDSKQSCKSKRSNGRGGNNVAGQRGNLRIPRYELQSILFNALMEEAASLVATAENGRDDMNVKNRKDENDVDGDTSLSLGPVKIVWNKRLISYVDRPMMNKLNEIHSSGEKKKKGDKQQQHGRSEEDKAVLLHFEDGTTDEVDLLVGADGVNSIVAKQYLSTTLPVSSSTSIKSDNADDANTTSQPRELGIFIILGISDYFDPLIDERGFYSLDGKSRLFIMPFKGSRLDDDSDLHDIENQEDVPNNQKGRRRKTMWQLSFPISDNNNNTINQEEAMRLKQLSQEEMQREVLQRIGNWHEPIPNLIKDTQTSTIWGASLLDRDPSVFINQRQLLESHGRIPSRVVIVGDAAHSMSPFKGQVCTFYKILLNYVLPRDFVTFVCLHLCTCSNTIQGANQALADGPLLASWLCKSKVDSAVRGFMTEMTRRSGVKVRASREAAKRLHSNDCWEWMVKQDKPALKQGEDDVAQAVFHGVQPQHVVELLHTLNERGINAFLGSKLDDAIREVIRELNIADTLPSATTTVQRLSSREMASLQSQALESAATGNMSQLRQLASKCRLIIPNAIDAHQRSCLHLAAMHGHVDVCRWLLSEVNIDCNMLDATKKKAVHLAIAAGKKEIENLLTKWTSRLEQQLYGNGDDYKPATITSTTNTSSSLSNNGDDIYRDVEQQLRGINTFKELRALLQKNRDSATVISNSASITHVLGCQLDENDTQHDKQCMKLLAKEHGAVILRNFIPREVDQVALGALALRPFHFDLSDALDKLRTDVNDDDCFNVMTNIGSSHCTTKSQRKRIGKCVEEVKSQLTISADSIRQTNFWPQLNDDNQSKKRKMDSFPLSRLRYINLGEWNYNWGDRLYEKVDSAMVLPDRLKSLAHRAHEIAKKQTNEVCTSPVSFDLAICNLYHLHRPSDRLGGHQDNVESDVSLPLVTVSLGAPGVFLLGGGTRQNVPTAILLRAGDCLVMSGKSRNYFHGVPTILSPDDKDDATNAHESITESHCVFPELNENGTLHNVSINHDGNIPSLEEMKFAKVTLASLRMNMSIRQV